MHTDSVYNNNNNNMTIIIIIILLDASILKRVLSPIQVNNLPGMI